MWDSQCRDCPIGKSRVDKFPSLAFVLSEFEWMIAGGYPFEANDLTRTEWIALGMIRRAREEGGWQKSSLSSSLQEPTT